MIMKKIKILMLMILVTVGVSVFCHGECFAAEKEPEGYETYTTKTTFGAYSQERYLQFHSRNNASTLVALKDGTYMRVHDSVFTREIIIEYYNKTFKRTGVKKVNYQLYQFNGFYTDGKYNYLMFSQLNTKMSSKKVVCRVVKYSRDWKPLKKCDIRNTNIKRFMWCTGSDMISDKGKLYIKTAREKYDGHQSTVTYVVRTSDMKLLEKHSDTGDDKYGYVSHSFAQYLALDGHNIVSAEHGDGSPRGVQVHDSSNGNNKLVIKCAGEWGQNYTGLQLGGLAVSGQAYITVGSSMNQSVKNIKDKDFPNYCRNSVSNVFINVWNKNTNKVNTVYLTDYKDNDELHIPYIVEVSRNRFVVMWSHNERVYYVEIDGTGKLATTIKSVRAQMSVKPIVNDGKIVWMSHDNNKNVTFYSLPLTSFKVKLSTPAAMKFSMQSDGIKLNWKCVSGADGYYLYRKEGKSFKKIATIKDGSITGYVDKKVKDGRIYRYTVKAYRQQGKKIYSKTKKTGWSYHYLEPVTIKSISNKKDAIRISWDDKKSENGYYVYREYNGKTSKIATINANKTSFNDKYAVEYQKYNYYVVQYKESSLTSVRGKRKGIYRVEPTDKKPAQNKNGYIEVEVCPLVNEDTYLYRSVNGGPYKKIATVKNKIYKDTRVSNGNSYRYKIVINYKGSRSDYSEVTEIEYLDRVTVTKAVNDKSCVKISWTENKKATKYYIYKKNTENSGFRKIAVIKGAGNTTFADNYVSDGQKAIYMVKAVSDMGESVESNEEQIVYLKEPRLDSVTVIKGAIKICVSIQNSGEVDLYRKTSNTNYVKIKHLTGDYYYTYLDKDVRSGETYTYTAKAVRGQSESFMDTGGVSVTFIQNIQSLNATMNENKVTLTWDKVEGALSYRIYNNLNNLLAETTDNRYELTLDENVEYRFSVASVGKDYTTSNIENTNVFYYLSNPQIESVDQNGDKAVININASPYYTKMELYINTKNGYVKTAPIEDWSRAYETFIPGDGDEYSYKIVATDKFGNTKEAVSNRKVSYIGATSMSRVTYDNSTNAVTVTWNEADNITSGYIVYKSINGGEYTKLTQVEGVSNTSYEDSEVSENNTYSYKVSVYGVAEGEKSSDISIFIPKSPDGLKVSRTGNAYNISWNPVEDCDEYILYIKFPGGNTNAYHIHDTSTETYAPHGVTEFYVTSYIDGVESRAPEEIVRAGNVNDSDMLSLEQAEGGYMLSFSSIEGVDGYALYRNDGEKEVLVSYIPKEVLLYRDTEGLESGKYYEYRLCGYIDDRENRYIGDGIKYRKMLFIARPVITELTAKDGRVSIQWEAVEGAVEYTLCRRKTGMNWTTYQGGITGTSYIDTDVTVGMEYEYGLIASSENTVGVSYFNLSGSKGDKVVVE